MLRIASLIIAAICVVTAQASFAGIQPSKAKPAKTPELVEQGRQIYFKRCSFCHGIEGGGDGPVAEYLNPRPRNFKTNVFKFRSTESGALPLDEDLFETISKGVRGTAMQSFDKEAIKTGLSEEERWSVIYFIQTFSETPDFSLWKLDEEFAKAASAEDKADYRYNKVVKIGDPPSGSDKVVEKGKEVYKTAKCFQCHGENGRGNGVSADGMKDDWKFPIVPRDLTKEWTYKGGSSVREIFFRFTTGLNGTPMPSFAKSVKEEDRWVLAHYVKSLQYEPGDKKDLTVPRVKGELPMTSGDPAWKKADNLDVRLTGNVLIKPRWQNITVDLVKVQALYNDKEIAFRLEWDDRFPNTIHEGHDDLHQLDQASPGDAGGLATYVPIYSPEYTPGKYRDAVMLQFPVKLVEGAEKPHFLNGDPGHAVNLWWWRADYDPVRKEIADLVLKNSILKPLEKYVIAESEPEKNGPAALELNAKGFKGEFKAQADTSQSVKSAAKYDDGVWTLVMKRPLVTDDKNDVQFEPGRFIPMAVNAWDGWNHDIGMQKSISSWHYIYLEKSMSAKVYIITVLAVLIIGGLEFYLIRKWGRSGSGA